MAEYEYNEPVEMQMYRGAFRQMISQKSPRIINNDSQTCASILIEELVSHATRTVRICSRVFDDSVWGAASIHSAIRIAVNNGISFNVLCGSDISDENRTYKLLEGLNVGIMRLPPGFAIQEFLVVDEYAFRLESGIESHNGVACAYSPINAQQLIQIFNVLSSQAMSEEERK